MTDPRAVNKGYQLKNEFIQAGVRLYKHLESSSLQLENYPDELDISFDDLILMLDKTTIQ